MWKELNQRKRKYNYRRNVSPKLLRLYIMVLHGIRADDEKTAKYSHWFLFHFHKIRGGKPTIFLFVRICSHPGLHGKFILEQMDRIGMNKKEWNALESVCDGMDRVQNWGTHTMAIENHREQRNALQTKIYHWNVRPYKKCMEQRCWTAGVCELKPCECECVREQAPATHLTQTAQNTRADNK